jgi:hypothetical protein
VTVTWLSGTWPTECSPSLSKRDIAQIGTVVAGSKAVGIRLFDFSFQRLSCIFEYIALINLPTAAMRRAAGVGSAINQDPRSGSCQVVALEHGDLPSDAIIFDARQFSSSE